MAAGAGCAIALACDLRVCTPDARFGVPIARTLGNALSIENCARLVEHLGLARTKDLLLTGRLLDAREAAAIGLVTRMAEPADVEPCRRRAGRGHRPQRPAHDSRDETGARSSVDAPAAWMRREATIWLPPATPVTTFAKGVAAFLEKRPPKFTGR